MHSGDAASSCQPAAAAAETRDGGTSSSEHLRYSSPMPAQARRGLQPASRQGPARQHISLHDREHATVRREDVTFRTRHHEQLHRGRSYNSST